MENLLPKKLKSKDPLPNSHKLKVPFTWRLSARLLYPPLRASQCTGALPGAAGTAPAFGAPPDFAAGCASVKAKLKSASEPLAGLDWFGGVRAGSACGSQEPADQIREPNLNRLKDNPGGKNMLGTVKYSWVKVDGTTVPLWLSNTPNRKKGRIHPTVKFPPPLRRPMRPQKIG